MSRIGKKPVELPSGVSATMSGQTIEVKGPKGTRSFTATDDVTIGIGDDAITVTPRGKSKRARQQWGMSRSMVQNLVTGVSEGFKKELEINGVGYRAQMQGNVLKLNLGYSHDVNFEVPEGVTVTSAKPSRPDRIVSIRSRIAASVRASGVTAMVPSGWLARSCAQRGGDRARRTATKAAARMAAPALTKA